MTVGELLTLLQRQADDSEITLQDGLALFNACSDEIALVARKRATATATLPPDTEIPEVSLPSDFVELLELRYSEDGQEFKPLVNLDLEPFRKSGYRIWGRVIRFTPALVGGVLQIDYFRQLARLTQETDEPEIPPQFHMIYVYYATARWLVGDDAPDVSQAQAAAEQRFQAMKQELSAYTATKEGGYAPVHTRDVLPRRARFKRDLSPEEWVVS